MFSNHFVSPLFIAIKYLPEHSFVLQCSAENNKAFEKLESYKNSLQKIILDNLSRRLKWYSPFTVDMVHTLQIRCTFATFLYRPVSFEKYAPCIENVLH